jgi:hypothetical protein
MVEAPHGRAAMAGDGTRWPVMGARLEGNRWGKKSRGWAASCGGQGRCAVGSCIEMGLGLGFAWSSYFAAALCVQCAGRRREKRREEGEKKKKKGKGKKEKEKNKMENFPNLKFSGEKNKRQFTELV